MKLAAAILFGGLAFYGLERWGMRDGKLFGALPFEADDAGNPKLGAGYLAAGGAIALGAVATGMLVHKVTGGRVPKGLSLAGK